MKGIFKLLHRNKIIKAIDFAWKKHYGQLDDDGKAYFHHHVARVATLVAIAGCDKEIIMAAYLHDTIEDTDTTYEELKKEFGER